MQSGQLAQAGRGQYPPPHTTWMQSLPGGHGIAHEPTASAAALRVSLLVEMGDARTSVHVLAFLHFIRSEEG